MIDTALGVKVLGCQAVREWSWNLQIGVPLSLDRKERRVASFLHEESCPLHKGGRKAAEEIVLAPSLEPGIVEGAGVKFSIY